MTRRLLIGALTVGVLCTVSVAQSADSVRIATNAPYRPMEYMTPGGKLTGFDIELGNALCQQANLECSWTNQSWNGIIPGLMAHKYDAIMSSMTINDKRKKRVLFSQPYIVVPSAFFVPSDSSLNKISDDTLADKSIGVQRGTIQDDYVTDKYSDIATIKRYQNADDVAVDMAAGRLDAAFFDAITGQSTLIDPNPDKYRQAGKDITKPAKYFGTGFGIAFRKNETDLAQQFNKALTALEKNGTYDRIYAEYFGNKRESSSGS